MLIVLLLVLVARRIWLHLLLAMHLIALGHVSLILLHWVKLVDLWLLHHLVGLGLEGAGVLRVDLRSHLGHIAGLIEVTHVGLLLEVLVEAVWLPIVSLLHLILHTTHVMWLLVWYLLEHP